MKPTKTTENNMCLGEPIETPIENPYDPNYAAIVTEADREKIGEPQCEVTQTTHPDIPADAVADLIAGRTPVTVDEPVVEVVVEDDEG